MQQKFHDLRLDIRKLNPLTYRGIRVRSMEFFPTILAALWNHIADIIHRQSRAIILFVPILTAALAPLAIDSLLRRRLGLKPVR